MLPRTSAQGFPQGVTRPLEPRSRLYRSSLRPLDVRYRPSLRRLADPNGRERYESSDLEPYANVPRLYQRPSRTPIGNSPRRHSRSLLELTDH
jgi:hypothetical protein